MSRKNFKEIHKAVLYKSLSTTSYLLQLFFSSLKLITPAISLVILPSIDSRLRNKKQNQNLNVHTIIYQIFFILLADDDRRSWDAVASNLSVKGGAIGNKWLTNKWTFLLRWTVKCLDFCSVCQSYRWWLMSIDRYDILRWERHLNGCCIKDDLMQSNGHSGRLTPSEGRKLLCIEWKVLKNERQSEKIFYNETSFSSCSLLIKYLL